MRSEWVAKRAGDDVRTQLHYARQGITTEEMMCVARSERLSPELVRSEVARGRGTFAGHSSNAGTARPPS